MESFVAWHAKPRYRTASANVGWVVAESGWHIWQGAKDSSGYGMVRHEGKSRRVHKLRYVLEVGVIPDGMELDHFVCDNPACCNPTHLRPATHYENVLRGSSFAALNKAKTHCPNGHAYADNSIPYFAARGKRACNACNNQRSAARYTKHGERIRAARQGYEKEYRVKNRDAINARARARYLSQKGEIDGRF